MGLTTDETKVKKKIQFKKKSGKNNQNESWREKQDRKHRRA